MNDGGEAGDAGVLSRHLGGDIGHHPVGTPLTVVGATKRVREVSDSVRSVDDGEPQLRAKLPWRGPRRGRVIDFRAGLDEGELGFGCPASHLVNRPRHGSDIAAQIHRIEVVGHPSELAMYRGVAVEGRRWIVSHTVTNLVERVEDVETRQVWKGGTRIDGMEPSIFRRDRSDVLRSTQR